MSFEASSPWIAYGLVVALAGGCSSASGDDDTVGSMPVTTELSAGTTDGNSDSTSAGTDDDGSVDAGTSDASADTTSDTSSTNTTDTTDTSTETTGSASGCELADILCEDFEDGLPSGGAWIAKSCTDPAYMMSVSEGALLTSGASTSANNSCPLHYDLGTLDSFWVTAHLRIVGNEPGMEHEVTFFELGEQENADDPELRIGYRGDSSCNNSGAVYAGLELGATQGPGGEYTGCTGLVPPAETWLCLEVSVDQDASSLVADMYLDGEPLDYLVHSQPQSEVLGNFAVRYLKVGMQSYSGQFDGLLLDDLSVSSTRVGCGG